MKRTHTCGELGKAHIAKKASLAGWCHSRRDHGGVIFIDLRDRYGITQVVFEPKQKNIFSAAEKLRREDVISVQGTVRARPKGMQNPGLKTGEIEVLVHELDVLTRAETPPIEIDDRVEINEDMRLKYRYLDLRRPKMQHNLAVRHKAAKLTRDYFDSQGFLEIETPMLAKSTPEGARDYLVPSRINPGKFYALPQSPQLFKQLLMVSGCDKYFQIVKCFRDEDLRADRQPEFTQIDVEMSFVEEEDIYPLIEGLVKKIWKEILGISIKTPFPRLSYAEAMEKYGIDKPDMRFGLCLIDVSDIARDSNFDVFRKVVNNGGMVKCINANNCAGFTRKDIEELTHLAGVYEAKGLAWMKVTEKGLESSIVKFFDAKVQKKLLQKTGAKKDDLLLFVADIKHSIVNAALAHLRLELGKRLKLIDHKQYSFAWIIDFPLLEFDETEQRYMALHHPFTSPKDKDIALLEKDPSKVLSKAYDLTVNGIELGGGSIRIHRPDIQRRMFSVLGLSELEAQQKFGFLLEAFKYGAPPHGGIALGMDRLVAILTGNESIREVIAFPKTKAAESLMEEAPSEVNEEQLKELHLKLDMVKLDTRDAVFRQIIDALDREKMEHEVIEHKPVYTSQEAADARGTTLEQGCKALICKLEKGFVQVVVGASMELDFKKLKKELHIQFAELATADDVKKVSGLSIGAVPPFGNLFGLKVYMDKSVLKNKEVAFNAGLHTKSIKMKAGDLLKVTGAKAVDVSG